MAKVDIVVPCYNYGRYLQDCVTSILDQSLRDLRVLIIDDASTDHTPVVASKLAAADCRVTVISHEQNWGHIRTYNQGLAWSSAEYFMLLSADDVLVPGALARAAAILHANPDVVLTHGKSIEGVEFPSAQDPEEEHQLVWVREEGIDLIAEYCSSGFNSISTPTVIVRNAVQKAVGGYRPSLPHSGDMEMWLRFATRGAFARICCMQAFKRLHASNMAESYYADRLPDWQQRKEAFDTFFEECGTCLPGSDGLRARAHRALAESAFIVGIAQLCRGNPAAARRLIRFAIGLRPSLLYWYWPPIVRLARTQDARKHVGKVLAAGARTLFSRNASA